jgi:hypothetical protein
MPESATAMSFDQQKVEKFVEKLVNDVGTAMRGALCYIGDKLRIFKAMAATGPVTVEELARHTGLNARYLQEWLGAMVTASYIEYNPETGRYVLPPEHAAPLADETFPYFVGGFLEMIVPTVSVAPKVAEAFRTGRGVDQNDYTPEMFESIERGTSPWYRTQLIQHWLPTMPQVVQALECGGSALDVGCGSGRAAITLCSAMTIIHFLSVVRSPMPTPRVLTCVSTQRTVSTFPRTSSTSSAPSMWFTMLWTRSAS